jgi:recombination protein RecR
MQTYPRTNTKTDPVSKLVFELSKLPGIGEKTASRLAYFILKQGEDYSRALSEAILTAKLKTGLCKVCFTLSDTDPCSICTDLHRANGILCVVEKPADVLSLEQAGVHHGWYHVLHGALSPLDGIGPEELKIRELLQRLDSTQATPITEVILALNPSVEGEATSMYITRLLRPFGIKITQLAHGIPVGGMLEYTDRQTIFKAMENRTEARS